MTAREPMPASFKPFWRFLLAILALIILIALASAVTGLALTG